MTTTKPASSISPSTTTTSTTSSLPCSFPPWDEPPMLGYGVFLDIAPPRGPYLWPCLPGSYEPSSTSSGVKPEPSHASTSSSTPQLVYGWYCTCPPPSPPYLWSVLPVGYCLVPAMALEMEDNTQDKAKQAVLDAVKKSQQQQQALHKSDVGAAMSVPTLPPLPLAKSSSTPSATPNNHNAATTTPATNATAPPAITVTSPASAATSPTNSSAADTDGDDKESEGDRKSGRKRSRK